MTPQLGSERKDKKKKKYAQIMLKCECLPLVVYNIF